MIIPIIIVILYFAPRLINLTTIPVFVDEAIYIRWSQVMRAEATLRFLPLSDGKQPLFMWITMPLFKLFSDPLVAGRMVSVLAGFSSIIAIGIFTYLITKQKAPALLASLLLAIIPYSLFFDRMALVDSLLASFGLWSLVFGVLTVQHLRLDTSLLLGMTLGLGLLTKSPAIFFYLWQGILAIFFIKKINTQKCLRLIALWAIAFVISQVMYNILRLGPNFHLVNSRNQDYLFSFSEFLTHPLNPLVRNLKITAGWLWFLLTPGLLWLIIPAFFKNIRKINLAILLLFLVPLLIQGSVAKVYTSRYLLFAVVPLVSLFAITLSSIKNKIVVVFSVLIPIFLSVWQIYNPITVPLPREMKYGYLEEWTAGWGQKEIGLYLKELASKGVHAVVGTEGFFGSLPDGLQIYTQNLPNITVIGSPWPVENVPSSLTNSLKDPQNEVYLVANKSRFLLNPIELAKVEFVKNYPKPYRPDGTREELLLYKLKRK